MGVVVAAGPAGFREMLSGFREMDEHFRTAPFEKNLPVLLGLLSDARHDFRWCARNNRLPEFLHALRIRWNQRLGKFAGFQSA